MGSLSVYLAVQTNLSRKSEGEGRKKKAESRDRSLEEGEGRLSVE